MTPFEACYDYDSSSESEESEEEIETGSTLETEPLPRKNFFVGVNRHLHLFVVELTSNSKFTVIKTYYDINLSMPCISLKGADKLEINPDSVNSEVWAGYLTNNIKKGYKSLSKHWVDTRDRSDY